jgi:hypothetical protein
MKYITGGFVGETEAGTRLMQVAHDPRCTKSGVYWSWNGGPREGRGDEALEKDGQILGGGGAGGGWDSIYENDQSDKVLNVETAQDLWTYSTIVTGAEWYAHPHHPHICHTECPNGMRIWSRSHEWLLSDLTECTSATVGDPGRSPTSARSLSRCSRWWIRQRQR